MKTWSWISASLLLGAGACSSGGSGGFSHLDSSGPGSARSASGGGGIGAGTSGGSSSGSSAPADGGQTATLNLGDADLPDADVDPPVILTMDTFTVKANSEVYMCQPFGNPFHRDVDLVKMDGTMSEGSHHFFLFNMPAGDITGRNKPGPLAPCLGRGIEFHPFPYLSQQPHYVVEYGAGMGYPLVGGNGLMINVHYLNTSSVDVTPKVTITIYPAKQGTVTTRVGTIFLNNQAINVPAGTPQSNPISITAANVPIANQDYTIFTNWSHMHKYSVDFAATAGNSLFYEEKQWSEPPLVTAGAGAPGSNTSPMLPMAMKSGTQIKWTCKYFNPTNSAMTFGDSANTDDMCIYLGQYYPAAGTPATNPNYPDIINAVNF